MVVHFEVKHIFKYPIELVTYTHLTKYPTDKEKNVLSVKTVKRIIKDDGIEYWNRVACCSNIVPSVLRKLKEFEQDHIYIEEECWLNKNTHEMNVRSRNLTWEKYGKLKEESLFKKFPENPKWTHFHQRGSIDLGGIGHIGWLIECFAEKFFRQSIKKSLRIMEELLCERMNGMQTGG
ncbi:PRELI domain-containing protein 2-like [Centruroides vittatus]|uniref:PRELI domain-containing protein 2-like n=1 Tax=Centruroides vittatus TaxID=120091 RepID=UPI00350EA4A8